jgi:preprotein translocase subunit SecD
MKRLLCVVVCLLAFARIATAQTRLEMRLAETEPGAGLTEATIPASGQTIYLHESTVITNADVIDAHVESDVNGRPSVAIRVTPDAAVRLENATRGHIGKPVAILVNGVVVSAPRLDGVLRQDAAIFGTFTQAEADKIAAGLMGR